ncbi:NirD/YgiW/YdeI family stress tolerance protein [Salinarimonas sp. NSM]|uniref:NirD/YgiW/YdeI family stress tolerance protein n=1 Tax=Salinarimonas sp. NSM TaxID=3458003 RepID=UPI004036049D
MKTLAALALALAIPLVTSPIAAQPVAVTPIAEAQRGTMVTVRGTVERITDEDEFRLADASGTIRVYVGPNWVPADVGEVVTVSGFVDDGLGPREIYARTLTRADGTVVAFERRYD